MESLRLQRSSAKFAQADGEVPNKDCPLEKSGLGQEGLSSRKSTIFSRWLEELGIARSWFQCYDES